MKGRHWVEMTPVVTAKTVLFLGKAKELGLDSFSWWVTSPSEEGKWYRIPGPPEEDE